MCGSCPLAAPGVGGLPTHSSKKTMDNVAVHLAETTGTGTTAVSRYAVRAGNFVQEIATDGLLGPWYHCASPVRSSHVYRAWGSCFSNPRATASRPSRYVDTPNVQEVVSPDGALRPRLARGCGLHDISLA